MTLSQLYQQTRMQLLKKEDKETAGHYARNLVCHISGCPAERFLAEQSLVATEETCRKVADGVVRLLADEPLAYVLGEWEFYGMKLCVNSHVLIPRDDTCAVTSLAIRQGMFLGKAPRVLDLCTGSGCIGLAVARNILDARVTLADISSEALAVAKKNILRNELSSRVTCYQTDALKQPESFLGKYDLIVSNPPYITTQEMRELPDSVAEYEPPSALFGGDDGLDFYRAIAKNYKKALKPGGFLCFEFGMGQGDSVCEILQINGYTILERSRDYNDIERAVLAQYARKD